MPIAARFSASAFLALLTAVAAPAASQTFESSAGSIEVTRVAGPFENPWALAFLPDGRMLVTERAGRLSLVDGAEITPVDGMPEIDEFGQGGLLDVIAAPDFETSGAIYFSYAETASEGLISGSQRTSVARGRLDLSAAPRLENVEVIFRQEPAINSRRHFGSRIVAADDGTLFIALGDRADPDRAQELDSHIGTIVRIHPDGSTPEDNPFIGREDALSEIWSYGHRNVQGAALHPETRELWTVEHGAQGGDEINRPEAGKNFGWPVISYGRHYSGGKIGVGTEAPGMEQPEFYWDPSIAPSGLAFYNGDLFPEWRGDLLVGALKFELLSRLDVENGEIVHEERLLEGSFGRVRDVRSGPDGAIWFITDEREGAVYRVAPASG